MIKKQKILLLISGFLLFSITLNSASLPPSLTKAIKAGKTEKANELAAEIVFSAEDAGAGARANAVMSILVYLEADPEAASRAESIGDFYLDTKDPEEKNAVTLLKYLAGKTSEKKLIEVMKTKSPDWQATATIARYVKILKDEGVNAKKLNSCVKSYMDISKTLKDDSWGNVWKARLVMWHNALQDKFDKGDGLEKLIFQVKDDISAGPLKAQLASINNIIGLLLKDKKNEASKAARKAISEIGDRNSAENQPYVPIVEYLSGKVAKVQDVYKKAQSNSDLFIMAGIAIFARDLSDAKDGEMRKSSFLIHLKNFLNNIGNTERKEILDWKKKVGEWNKWLNNEYPLKSGQASLLARHSRAYAEKNKDRLEKKTALKLYENLKASRSISSVSVSDFAKVRALFKKRPKPDNMDFGVPGIKEYLKTLPFETQQGEWGRARYMKTFTENMATILNFTQYSGSIRMKSRTLKGKVVSANTNAVTIKVRSRSKKYKWSDIKPEQFIAFNEDFIKYYIGGKVKGKENIFSTKTETDKALAKNYRLISIFCDWYGLYPEAIKNAKQAAKYPRYDKGSTRQLLLD